MSRHKLVLLAIGLALLVSRPVLRAHHAEAAEYDAIKPVKVSGMLTKVEWQNPHVWFYVEVKEQDGKLTTWGFSTAPPGALMRRGVTTLRPDWDKLCLLEYVCEENNRCPGGQCRESSA